MTFPRFLLSLIGLLLTACSAAGLDLPTATLPPPADIPSQTPTIVWFPATNTPTPPVISTQPPTPELIIGLGDITTLDDFSDESIWDTAISDEGSASIGRQRLTIAVQPGVYLQSLRNQLTVSDFYAEITARPSLCRGTDEYGLLIRATATTYYRFVLACDRSARLELVLSSKRTVLVKPVISGDVPPGPPGEVRIGVWAAGPELRFFLNGRHQFSLTDKNISAGTLGVFARATGDTPVTVTFSDLVVRSVIYTPPTATPVTPTP